MRSFRVGGGLILVDNRLLLAANRRRQGMLEWTPPGGVIDDGESVLEAITREVAEETGLTVNGWEDRHYCVHVSAPDMGWDLTVESWLATAVEGEIALNDPDGIVERAEFVDVADVARLMEESAPWVRIPLLNWLELGRRPMEPHHFRVFGVDRATARVEQWAP